MVRKFVEWIGTHPLATGFLAILGVAGTLLAVVDHFGSAAQASKTNQDLADISATTQRSESAINETYAKSDEISGKIDGLSDKIASVEEKALAKKTAAEGYIPSVSELPYDIARPRIIEAGWIPIKSRWQTIGEFEYSRWALWHHGFEEVSACAGTGRGECRFEFHNGAGLLLHVVTFGEVINDIDFDKKEFVGRPNFGNFRVNEAWTEPAKP